MRGVAGGGRVECAGAQGRIADRGLSLDSDLQNLADSRDFALGMQALILLRHVTLGRRIVQTNPEAAILEVRGAVGVRIHNLTLTRAEGAKDARAHGLHIENSREVEVVGVHIIDNRSTRGTLYIERCEQVRIEAGGGLTDADIERMRAEAEANADADKAKRALVELKNEADAMVYETEMVGA